MEADITGAFSALTLPVGARNAAQTAGITPDLTVHVTTTPALTVCLSTYGMHSRALGQVIGRLDVAAITAARLAGHFVHPYYIHGVKFVLWCARYT